MATKVCSKCGEEKDVEEFYKNRKHRDGLGTYCKSCYKTYSRDYVKRNPDYHRNYQKKWRKTRTGIESITTSRDKHHKTQKYKDRIKDYARRDDVKIKHKMQKLTPMAVFSYTKDSARKRNIVFQFTYDSFKEFYEKSHICYYCEESMDTICAVIAFIKTYEGRNDEILSWKTKTKASHFQSKRLSVDRKKSSGEYSEQNCVMACPVCNSAKGFLIPSEIYKKIAPAVIANIVRICKEAGLEV